MEIPYNFHPKVVLRTPAEPFSDHLQRFEIAELLRDNAFLESLWLASPVLYEALLKYRDGGITEEREVTDLRHSLGKYFLRMRTRCTPFGLFSGCSVASWEAESPTRIIRAARTRHTRFDMHYLCAFAQHLAKLPFVRDGLAWFPNSSWYKIGDEVRYVEYHYVNGQRHHQICSVNFSEQLGMILQRAANGISVAEVVALLVEDGIDEEEAAEFTSELIASQLLVSSLDPAITGEEFLSQVVTLLRGIEPADNEQVKELVERLDSIAGLISRIDDQGVNPVVAYEEIITLVNKLGIPFDKAKLFQTDTFYQLAAGAVDTVWQSRILEALDVLGRLDSYQENGNLRSFMRRFQQRYEDREMPLLEVLDTETGIGYLENFSGDVVPMVDDLLGAGKPRPESLVSLSFRDKYLAEKLSGAFSAHVNAIELDPEELRELKAHWENLSPTLSVLFRLLPGNKILLENAIGSSAANFLGRFAHGSKEIHGIIKDIVETEDRTDADVIFAEIVHLPESRIGNVLLHPAFRRYEIPFLARPSVPGDYQIPLSDILVSVRKGQIYLRSAKRNKRIIPRLSTAHNYSFKALPVYQFLCDLQLQGKQGTLFFHWGALGGLFPCLPRVTCKEVVLSPAQWTLKKKDLDVLRSGGAVEWPARIAGFRAKWNLPAKLVLSDGDNELFLNLDDETSTRIWLDAVKNRDSFMLKEFLGAGEGTGVSDEAGSGLANQFIASLIRQTPSYAPIVLPQLTQTSGPVQRFSLGSEWVYLQLYCGARTADKILLSALGPLVTELLAGGLIDRFFFIRYNDPSFHLRLRLHLTRVEHLGPVLERFSQYIKPFEEQGFVWKVQTDTYGRELTRYGPSTMLLSEELFYIDSLWVLELLGWLDGLRQERGDAVHAQYRWLWLLRSIDEWLDVLGLSLDDKLETARYLKESYHAEFKTDKVLRGLLSDKYRVHKSSITALLDKSQDVDLGGEPILPELRKRNQRVMPEAAEIRQTLEAGQGEVSLPELLYSHIHMMANRVVTSESRLHELVLYDILHTWYRSVIGRRKYNKEQNIPLPA